ncbi:sushi, von Willebrand factor type A, EGF and pentraxin domain-containing protein 1-like [Amphiura filiformis]|uniref:sushi, von Willebrand factor type A, EGF and pentraxin domain-containing protein 1-like n=1 Tax=Amphiura filiformis TaxID=82378 RepID=UPI003B20FA45
MTMSDCLWIQQSVVLICIIFAWNQVLCQRQCPSGETSCPGGFCILNEWVCDTVVHCLDGADERNCDPMPDCPIDYERCPGSNNAACIRPSWRCDGVNDCADHSDEDINWCRTIDCPYDMVKCTNSGRCIKGQYLCNGIDECLDGSGADEPQSYCTSHAFTCPSYHFECDNGLCIPDQWLCDADDDCGDRSDEDNFDCSAVTCRPGYFRCAENKPRQSICIPDYCLCDGIVHCEDGEDELPPQCAAPTVCDVGSFQCSNGLCIPEYWVCDTENDCGDESDEGSGCVYSPCIRSYEFACANRRCVNLGYTCDGVDDCRDGSDEDASICSGLSTNSCGYLRDTDVQYNCSGITHGSWCSFQCTGSGYTLCPGISVLICIDGDWVGRDSALCCDLQAPSFQSCPSNKTREAGRNAHGATINWSTPQASDNSGTVGPQMTKGNASGTWFTEGPHLIEYTVRDSAGNTATCSFTVTVFVNKCDPLVIDTNQQVECSNGHNNFIYGSVCTFSCTSGWCLEGVSSLTCENTGSLSAPDYTWSGEQPMCRASPCTMLNPPTHGYFIGSCSVLHGSICTFGCNSGYRIHGNIYRECRIMQSGDSCDGEWSGEQPTCNDIEPPVLSCPAPITQSAGRDSLQSDYSWDVPQVSDNSGENIRLTQTSGPSRGSMLDEGTNMITYEASDLAGNTASCSFTVTIIVHRCNRLTPRSNQYISCSNQVDGFVYGSTCSFLCTSGYVLDDSPSITCEHGGTMYDWNGQQPTCVDDGAPSLLCPDPMTRYADQNEVEAVVSWSTPQVVDNSGNAISARRTDTLGGSSGSRFPEGSHIIEYEASDAAGNIATCSFTITVRVNRCETRIPTGNQQMTCSNQPDNFIHGSICTFSCDNGWCIDGNTAISCVSTGTGMTWSAPQPTCNVVTCPSLTPPTNGYSTSPSCSTGVGSICSFGCSTGYQLYGDGTRQCSVDESSGSSCLGAWGGVEPLCRDSEAPPLMCPSSMIRYAEANEISVQVSWNIPQVPDSTVRQTSGASSGSLFFEGSHVIEYEASDTYGNIATCEFAIQVRVNRCEELILLTNQQMTCTNNQHNIRGSTCTFTCNSGWCLAGSSSLSCENTGTSYNWNRQQPTCNVVQCEPLSPPDNGQFTGPCVNKAGSTCTIECNAGYRREGVSSRRCIPNESTPCMGTWNGQQPTCTGMSLSINCPADIVRYAERNTVSTIVTWNTPQVTHNSGESIQAVQVEGSPSGSSFAEGLHLIIYEARDSAGNIAATCSTYVEVIVHRCEVLVPVGIGMACTNQPNNFIYGSTCTFTCESGLCLAGSSSRTCENIGTDSLPDCNWTGQQPACNVPRCPDLVPPVNGHIVSGGSVCTGLQCEMACNVGYEAIGDASRYCELGSDSSCESATWSGLPLQCQGDNTPRFTELCPGSITSYAPKYYQSAFVSWNVAAVDNSGRSLDVSCSLTPGFMVEGYYSLECSATDANGNQATCTATITVSVRRCQPSIPELPEHGSIDTELECFNHHGGDCRIQCADGYRLQGSRRAICEYNVNQGQTYWSWTGQPPICLRQVSGCATLPTEWSSSAPYDCTQANTLGSVCTFSCPQQGYVLTAGTPAQLICQSDGTWNADISTMQPRCDDIQPPSILVDFCQTGPIQGELSSDLSAEVNFIIPRATDNSQQTPRVETVPSDVTSPYRFNTDTLVIYRFYDQAGNMANCSFQVTVINNLPPTTISCPRSEDLFFTSTSGVDWQLPQFINPVSAETIIPLCSHQPDDDFLTGEHTVTCTATNQDNYVSTTCVFVITVEPCPSLPTLTNGIWNCNENIMQCNQFCNAGYDVRKGAPTVFTCGDSGWLPPVSSIIPCERSRLPNNVQVTTNTTGGTFDDCTNIEQTIDNLLKGSPSLENDPCSGKCSVIGDSVEVDCRPSGPVSPRKRRDAPPRRITVCFTAQANVEGQGQLEIDSTPIQNVLSFANRASQMVTSMASQSSSQVIFGNIVCKCYPGDVPALNAQLMCVPCEPNTFENGGQCDQCPPGTHQPTEGQTSCLPLP